jgi:hypothetical protein
VIVLETVGSISDFFNAVRRIGGMEWLAEIDEEMAADKDFYRPDKQDATVGGRLFLVMANRAALDELLRLWAAYQAHPERKFEWGFDKWRQYSADCELYGCGMPRIVCVTRVFSKTGVLTSNMASGRCRSKRNFGFVAARRLGRGPLSKWRKQCGM